MIIMQQFKGEDEIQEVSQQYAEDRLRGYWKEIDWNTTSKEKPLWTCFACYWKEQITPVLKTE